MTGLDIDKDEICEIAVIVTDGDLKPVDEGIQVVVKPSDAAMQGMGDFVRQMHTDSGLLAEIPNGNSSAAAELLILDYLKKYITEPKSAPLAGNSIGTDRMFIIQQMPNLDAFLHYRNIDVSSLKELVRRWYPRVYFNLPKKNGSHRALADIRESIQELRYYRASVLVSEPGPDSEKAKQIAKALADTI
jgi:oligoribonuclease